MIEYFVSFEKIFKRRPNVPKFHIDLDDGIDPVAYFIAGFLYTNRPLSPDFFTTPAAKRIYFKFLRDKDREFDEWNMRRSFFYIKRYCKKNSIDCVDYMFSLNRAGNRTFLRHMKNFGISRYMVYKDPIRNIISDMESDTRFLYFGEENPCEKKMTMDQKNTVLRLENEILG